MSPHSPAPGDGILAGQWVGGFGRRKRIVRVPVKEKIREREIKVKILQEATLTTKRVHEE
jgi:hypothetical protein